MFSVAVTVMVTVTIAVPIAEAVIELAEVERGGDSIFALRTVGETVVRGRGWGWVIFARLLIGCRGVV